MEYNPKKEAQIKKIKQGNLIYSLNEEDKTASVIKNDQASGNVVIPRSITHESQEYIIISISNKAFEYSDQLESVQFPSDSELQIIEKNAFNNSSIKSTTFPSSLVDLKDGWCNETRCLVNIEIMPDNPRYKTCEDKLIIGKSRIEQENFDVLVFCPRNIKKVTIPSFIEIIAPYAFDECEQLQEFEITKNSNLKMIMKNAFACSALKKISLPPTLVDLNNKWCVNISYLTDIYIDSDNPRYKMYDKFIIGKSTMEQNNYDVLVFCARDVKKATIPNFIEVISPFAFEDCRKLQEVEIPIDSKLRVIMKGAFIDSSIKSIFIPPHVKVIDKFAFMRCKQLRCVEIPENSELQKIGEGAFSSSSIESITIPSNLVELNAGWCVETKNLIHIKVMPDNPRFAEYEDDIIIGKSNIEQENYDVLVFCARDIKAVVVPDYIEIIDENAFDECQQLQVVKFSADSKLKIIRKFAFCGSTIECIFIPSSLEIIEEGAFYLCTKMTYIGISDNSKLQIIGKGAFNSSSITSFNVPPHLIRICDNAFYHCKNLFKVTIPEDSELQIIENSAFYDTSIQQIFIPRHLKKICKFAFYKTNLWKCEIQEDSELQVIGRSVFGKTILTSITFPPSLINLKNGWCSDNSDLKNVTIMPGNPRYASYEDKYIIGKSNIEQENYDVLVFCARKVVEAVIPSFIEIIAPYAFERCHSLKKIEIPFDSKLKTIGKFAFSFSRITKIVFPECLEQIDEYAFYYSRLTDVEIPINSKLRRIDSHAFTRTSIKHFTIPSNLIELSENWCNENKNLIDIEVNTQNPLYSTYDNKFVIKKSKIEQENYDVLIFCFKYVETATIPSFIEIIGQNSFAERNQLESIEFPIDSKLRIIEKNAFSGSSIESLSLPSSLIELKEGWSTETAYLTNIKVMPKCKNYIQYDNDFILGKINKNSDEYDVLVFASRGITNATIPSFIKKIGEFAFNHCENLSKIIFSENSDVRTFEENSFSYSSIDKFFVPSGVTRIGNSSFFACKNLRYVRIPNDSELQTIEFNAFAYSSIECFEISPHVIEIGEGAFNGCYDLQIVEIGDNSKSIAISFMMFINCGKVLIMISN